MVCIDEVEGSRRAPPDAAQLIRGAHPQIDISFAYLETLNQRSARPNVAVMAPGKGVYLRVGLSVPLVGGFLPLSLFKHFLLDPLRRRRCRDIVNELNVSWQFEFWKLRFTVVEHCHVSQSRTWMQFDYGYHDLVTDLDGSRNFRDTLYLRNFLNHFLGFSFKAVISLTGENDAGLKKY